MQVDGEFHSEAIDSRTLEAIFALLESILNNLQGDLYIFPIHATFILILSYLLTTYLFFVLYHDFGQLVNL